MFEKPRDIPAALVVRDNGDEVADQLALEWSTARLREVEGELLLFSPRREIPYQHSALRQVAGLHGVVTASSRDSALHWSGGVALVLWPDRQGLARIATDSRARAICVIEWNHEATTPWARGAQPTILGGNRTFETADLADQTVAVALGHLTTHVNQNNALASYDDSDAAIATLTELRKRGHGLVADDIYAWALREGWHGPTAEVLRALVVEISGGKRKRIHHYPFRPDVYDIWTREAAEKSSAAR